jgi:Icc protein
MMLIAQISDIHITRGGLPAFGIADTLSSLQEVIGELNRLDPTPEAVIISGDISDDGSPESYAIVGQLLTELNMPFYLTPGNHDQKQNLANAFADHDYLATALEQSGGDAICYTVDTYPVRLIGLDTVITGEHGGGLNENRLDWLDKTLSQNPSKPTLIFMHHLPCVSSIVGMDTEPFVNSAAFARLIARHDQIQRITCGHLHRPIASQFGSTVLTVSPGVGMQLNLDLRTHVAAGFIMEPTAFLLHHWLADWDGELRLLTHTHTIQGSDYRWGAPHRFTDVVSPS